MGKTKEEMLAWLDNHMTLHVIDGEGPRYCIPIKVRDLKFTDEQLEFIGEFYYKVLDYAWTLILTCVTMLKLEHGVKVYSGGSVRTRSLDELSWGGEFEGNPFFIR